MRDDGIVELAVVLGLIALLVIAAVALKAGDIVNQLLAPFPSVAGPLGAAVALVVFVFLIGKGLELIFSRPR